MSETKVDKATPQGASHGVEKSAHWGLLKKEMQINGRRGLEEQLRKTPDKPDISYVVTLGQTCLQNAFLKPTVQRLSLLHAGSLLIEWAMRSGAELSAYDTNQLAKAHMELWEGKGVEAEEYNLSRARNLFQIVFDSMDHNIIDIHTWLCYNKTLQYIGDKEAGAECILNVLRIFEQSDEYPLYLLHAGSMLKALGKHNDAANYLFESLQVGPPKLFSKLEMMFLISRNIEESLKADDDNAATDDAYTMVYEHLIIDGDISEDVSYDDWISDSNTWNDIADKCNIAGIFSMATDLYGQALLRDSSAFMKPKVWFRFAKSCKRCGRTSDAQLAIKQALTINPFNQQLLKAQKCWTEPLTEYESKLKDSKLIELLDLLPSDYEVSFFATSRLQARLRGRSDRKSFAVLGARSDGFKKLSGSAGIIVGTGKYPLLISVRGDLLGRFQLLKVYDFRSNQVRDLMIGHSIGPSNQIGASRRYRLSLTAKVMDDVSTPLKVGSSTKESGIQLSVNYTDMDSLEYFVHTLKITHTNNFVNDSSVIGSVRIADTGITYATTDIIHCPIFKGAIIRGTILNLVSVVNDFRHTVVTVCTVSTAVTTVYKLPREFFEIASSALHRKIKQLLTMVESNACLNRVFKAFNSSTNKAESERFGCLLDGQLCLMSVSKTTAAVVVTITPPTLYPVLSSKLEILPDTALRNISTAPSLQKKRNMDKLIKNAMARGDVPSDAYQEKKESKPSKSKAVGKTKLQSAVITLASLASLSPGKIKKMTSRMKATLGAVATVAATVAATAKTEMKLPDDIAATATTTVSNTTAFPVLSSAQMEALGSSTKSTRKVVIQSPDAVVDSDAIGQQMSLAVGPAVTTTHDSDADGNAVLDEAVLHSDSIDGTSQSHKSMEGGRDDTFNINVGNSSKSKKLSMLLDKVSPNKSALVSNDNLDDDDDESAYRTSIVGEDINNVLKEKEEKKRIAKEERLKEKRARDARMKEKAEKLQKAKDSKGDSGNDSSKKEKLVKKEPVVRKFAKKVAPSAVNFLEHQNNRMSATELLRERALKAIHIARRYDIVAILSMKAKDAMAKYVAAISKADADALTKSAKHTAEANKEKSKHGNNKKKRDNPLKKTRSISENADRLDAKKDDAAAIAASKDEYLSFLRSLPAIVDDTDDLLATTTGAGDDERHAVLTRDTATGIEVTASAIAAAAGTATGTASHNIITGDEDIRAATHDMGHNQYNTERNASMNEAIGDGIETSRNSESDDEVELVVVQKKKVYSPFKTGYIRKKATVTKQLQVTDIPSFAFDDPRDLVKALQALTSSVNESVVSSPSDSEYAFMNSDPMCPQYSMDVDRINAVHKKHEEAKQFVSHMLSSSSCGSSSGSTEKPTYLAFNHHATKDLLMPTRALTCTSITSPIKRIDYTNPKSNPLAFLSKGDVSSGPLVTKSLDLYRSKGYADGNDMYAAHWRRKVYECLQYYPNAFILKKSLSNLQKINPHPISINEAFCALADANGNVPEALGKLSNKEFVRELNLVCALLPIDDIILTMMTSLSQDKSFYDDSDVLMMSQSIDNISLGSANVSVGSHSDTSSVRIVDGMEASKQLPHLHMLQSSPAVMKRAKVISSKKLKPLDQAMASTTVATVGATATAGGGYDGVSMTPTPGSDDILLTEGNQLEGTYKHSYSSIAHPPPSLLCSDATDLFPESYQLHPKVSVISPIKAQTHRGIGVGRRIVSPEVIKQRSLRLEATINNLLSEQSTSGLVVLSRRSALFAKEDEMLSKSTNHRFQKMSSSYKLLKRLNNNALSNGTSVDLSRSV